MFLPFGYLSRAKATGSNRATASRTSAKSAPTQYHARQGMDTPVNEGSGTPALINSCTVVPGAFVNANQIGTYSAVFRLSLNVMLR